MSRQKLITDAMHVTNSEESRAGIAMGTPKLNRRKVMNMTFATTISIPTLFGARFSKAAPATLSLSANEGLYLRELRQRWKKAEEVWTAASKANDDERFRTWGSYPKPDPILNRVGYPKNKPVLWTAETIMNSYSEGMFVSDEAREEWRELRMTKLKEYESACASIEAKSNCKVLLEEANAAWEAFCAVEEEIVNYNGCSPDSILLKLEVWSDHVTPDADEFSDNIILKLTDSLRGHQRSGN